jgi:Domain of unknown function (DUF4384)
MISLLELRASIERCSTMFLALFLLPGIAVRLESQPANTGVVSVRLEQKQGNVTKEVPLKRIFHAGDVIRFRITSRVAGYLYVLNQGSSGETATLFPSSDGTEESTRVQKEEIRSVPDDSEGWFEVSGPPGFDTIYFLISAMPIYVPPAGVGRSQRAETAKPASPPPPGALPRCDDEIFKARGECIDPTAGVAPLAADAPVPRELIPAAKSASRDIVITDDDHDIDIRTSPSAKLPLIYTFRLAHLE